MVKDIECELTTETGWSRWRLPSLGSLIIHSPKAQDGLLIDSEAYVVLALGASRSVNGADSLRRAQQPDWVLVFDG